MKHIEYQNMGDIVDDHNNRMPVPGNGRAKRARIDREGNFVAGKDVYGYNTSVTPAIRYSLSAADGRTLVSVLYWGADPTGVAASDTAFAAALASAACTIFVPPGNYRLQSTVTVPAQKSLIGDCRASTNLDFVANAAAFVGLILSQNSTLGGVVVRNIGTNQVDSIAVTTVNDFQRMFNVQISAIQEFAIGLLLDNSDYFSAVDTIFKGAVTVVKITNGSRFSTFTNSSAGFPTAPTTPTTLVEIDNTAGVSHTFVGMHLDGNSLTTNGYDINIADVVVIGGSIVGVK